MKNVYMHNVYKYSKYIDTLVVIENLGLNELMHCTWTSQDKIVGAEERARKGFADDGNGYKLANRKG